MKPIDKIKFLKNIKTPTQKSTEWLEQRKHRLTASDTATALGVNPYETRESLLLRKCGIERVFKGNEATKHGEKYENEAIELYCKLMSKTNYTFGLVNYSDLKEIRTHYDPTCEFLAASPDGIATDNNDLEDLVLLEVKCPTYRQIKYGHVPDHYMPQIQQNLIVFDIQKADFIEYIPAGYKGHTNYVLNIVRVHRSDKWYSQNLPILINFWNEVLEWSSKDITTHPCYETEIKKLKKNEKEKENENEPENNILEQNQGSNISSFRDIDTSEQNQGSNISSFRDIN